MVQFEAYDTDGSGAIDEDELLEVLNSMGEGATIEKAREMIDAVDDDGSGEIEFAEFLQIILKVRVVDPHSSA